MSTQDSTFNWVGTERRVAPVLEEARDPVTELDRRVWQMLHDEGGYWTWAELRTELAGVPEVAAWTRGPSPLQRLYNRCHVVRRRVNTCSGQQWAYGVTVQCAPLPMVRPAQPAQPVVPVFLQGRGLVGGACA